MICPLEAFSHLVEVTQSSQAEPQNRHKRAVKCENPVYGSWSANGLAAHENTCIKFYACDPNTLEIVSEHECNSGSHFEPIQGFCLAEADAGCTLPGPSTCDYIRKPPPGKSTIILIKLYKK